MRRAVFVGAALVAGGWLSGCQALLVFGDGDAAAQDGGSDANVTLDSGGGSLDGESGADGAADARPFADGGSLCSFPYELCDEFEDVGANASAEWNGFWGAGPASVFSVVEGGAQSSVGSARFLSTNGSGQLYLFHEISGTPQELVCEFWLKLGAGSEVIPFSFGYDDESLDWRIDSSFSSLVVANGPAQGNPSVFPSDTWRDVRISITNSSFVDVAVGGATVVSRSFALSRVQAPRVYFGVGILNQSPATVWFDDIRCTVQ